MTNKSFEAEIELTLRFCHQVWSKSRTDAEMWFDDLDYDDAMILLKENNLMGNTVEAEVEIRSVEEMF